MFELLARAFTLGVTATVLPGPLQMFTIGSTLGHGWRKSIFIGAAPFLADLPVMLIVLLLLRQFPPALLTGLQIAGGLFILYLAYMAYLDYRRNAAIGGAGTTDQATAFGLVRRAAMINLLAPSPWIFWSTIHGPLVIQTMDESIGLAVLYVAVFYITFFLGMGVLVLIFERVRQIDGRVTRIILLISVIALAFFGATLLLQGITAGFALFQNAPVGVN